MKNYSLSLLLLQITNKETIMINYYRNIAKLNQLPKTYNSLLLKLTVQEQLEFGKMFQVYTSKQEECKNTTLPKQLPYDSRKIKVELQTIF